MRDTVRGNNFSVVSRMTFAHSDELTEVRSICFVNFLYSELTNSDRASPLRSLVETPII